MDDNDNDNYATTVRDLLIWLADNFHDWLDGDDPVENYVFLVDNNQVFVKFESGNQFVVTVAQVYE